MVLISKCLIISAQKNKMKYYNASVGLPPSKDPNKKASSSTTASSTNTSQANLKGISKSTSIPNSSKKGEKPKKENSKDKTGEDELGLVLVKQYLSIYNDFKGRTRDQEGRGRKERRSKLTFIY
jgi:hypothetical protein